MRQTCKVGMEEWEVVPFCSYAREERCTTITVTIDAGVVLWWVIQGVEITVTLHVDPATSATSAGTYTREFVMERELLDPALLEGNLEFPGFDADFEQQVAPFEPGCFAFLYADDGPVGEDDVFDSTETSAALNLWDGGYSSGGPGLVTLSFKLRFAMVYDDGTEGTLLIQSIPVDDPDPFDGIYFLDTTASFLGNDVPVRVGDTAAGPAGPSTYMFGGNPPDISLALKLWFEYKRANGTEPIYDAATGAVLIDPRTRVE